MNILNFFSIINLVCGSQCINLYMLFSNNKEWLVGFILFQFRALSDQLYRSPNLHKFVREQVVQQVCWFYNDVFTCLVVLPIIICIDSVFLLFCQLKSDPDLYAGYVPMAYSEYLKKMSRYATMCTYAVMLLMPIWLLSTVLMVCWLLYVWIF